MNKSEIIQSLINCNNDLLKSGYTGPVIDCYIVGGSAVILTNMNDRASNDIDIIKHTGSGIPLLGVLFQKYNINCDVSAYFDNFPVGFAKRATQLALPTDIIHFHTLSVEDLVISKLCTTRDDRDLEDIITPSTIEKINWDTLSMLADSMQNSMISSFAYDNFKYHYDWFVKEYGPYEYALD